MNILKRSMNKVMASVGTSAWPCSEPSTIIYVSKMIQRQVKNSWINTKPRPRGLDPMSMPIRLYMNRVIMIVEMIPPRNKKDLLLENNDTSENEPNAPVV
jgi:hypothetical protein